MRDKHIIVDRKHWWWNKGYIVQWINL